MPSIISTLLFATSTLASTFVATNLCQTPVYLTYTDGSGTTTGPTTIAPGANVSQAIVGGGNSYGLTTNSDYYSPDTEKLIIGASTSNGQLYWSPSDVDGNPFADLGFGINSPDTYGADVCGAANSPDGQTRACTDGDFELTVDLCPTY